MKNSLYTSWLFIAAAALAGAACAPDANGDSGPLAEFKAAIRAQYDLKERAFADDDADLVVDQFYAEDVYSVDNEGNAHSGREALRPGYHEVVPPHTVRIESVRTHVEGNSGWDWANFYVTPDDPQGDAFSFAILFLWERRDGKWWCVGDIYVVGELPDEAGH